jgi:hypothetical protein
MTLAEQQQQPGWWEDFKDTVSPGGIDYASLESDATHLDAFEMGFIPGLLQTEDYARSIIRSDLNEPKSGKLERYLSFRMARQQILDRPVPPELRLVLDEAALRRTRGGHAVMQEQLRKVLEHARKPHITLQVRPFSCADDPDVTASFWILDINRPPILSTALITHLTGRLLIECAADLTRYSAAFDRLRASALSEPHSQALIERILSGL